MKTRSLVLAALGAMFVVSAVSPAMANYHDWRRHEWREHQWRVHHWREYHHWHYGPHGRRW